MTSNDQQSPVRVQPVVGLLAKWKLWRNDLRNAQCSEHVLQPATLRGCEHALTSCIAELEELLESEKQSNACVSDGGQKRL